MQYQFVVDISETELLFPELNFVISLGADSCKVTVRTILLDSQEELLRRRSDVMPHPAART